jgi:beta-galactosidase
MTFPVRAYNPNEDDRDCFSLNGDWAYSPCQDRATAPSELAPDLAWDTQPLQIPSVGLPGGARAGFLRRDFRLRPLDGQRAWVRFAAIGGAAVFFLNGKRIYASRESLLPVEFDITDHTERLDNQLIVWCGPHPGAPANALADLRGPWRAVSLVYTRAVTIPAAVVRVSLRRGQLEADISLENRTQSDVQASLSLALLDGPERRVELARTDVELRAGVMTTLRQSAPWPAQWKPRPWSPKDPHHYQLALDLTSAGQTLDTRLLRFGWRELWQAGSAWLLNGQALILNQRLELDSAQLDPAHALALFRQMRAAGVDLLELTGAPPLPDVLDAADECGLLLLGGYTQGLDPQQRPEHQIALLRRDRNHPSLLAWRLDTSESAQKLALYALDPTRPLLNAAQSWPNLAAV